jgi:hypothetical protein
MATKFKPLTLEGVEEGTFIDDADQEFAELQKKLIAFVRKHKDKAEKAAAELCMKLTIKCENPDDHLFSVKSAFSMKLPCRPAAVSAAIADADDEGDDVLFVQSSGSSRGNPRQRKLATQDGRTIDQETGEPIEA